MTQTEQLYRGGQLLVDKVVRYEDLANGLKKVLTDFDLPAVELLIINKGRHRDRDYMKHFTGEAHALFLARYGEDFDNFGYDR